MWRKIVRIVGFVLAVALIAAYICYASHLAQIHRAEQTISEIVISLSDSTATQQFASSEQIRKQLLRGEQNIENSLIDSIDVVSISDCIARNGYVRDVDVYITYSGKLYVDVKQHEPTLRLMCGGMNSYITEEYEIFRSPQRSAYYTAVVTGGYTPHFPRGYEGNVLDYYSEQFAKEDAKLRVLAGKNDSLRRRQRSCEERKAKLRKSGNKRKWEREESYKQRKVGVMQEMQRYNDELAALNQSKEALRNEELVIANRKKKLQKSCDDFTNLINFVTQIREHSFWGAEIVQFVADVTAMGDLTLRLVPRSGDFIIEFGGLDNSEEKLSKLQKFYDKGLSYIGWSEYKTIDVRYDKQVICTK